MRIGANGRIKIPDDVWDKAGLLPGSEVSVDYDGTAVRIVRTVPEDVGKKLVELLRGAGDIDLSTDEIMAMTRGE